MNTLETLKRAIEIKKPISFEYNKERKVQGERIGNPHAVFIFTAKSGEQSTKIDLVQTSGVSDSENKKPLPSWRSYNIENLCSAKILETKNKFAVDKEYKPESDRYKNVIAKI